MQNGKRIRSAPRIDLARRAEIATEKRNRTRAAILVAAFHLIGDEAGQFQRVEDFCKAASVARGTFYKYFNDIPHLYLVLAHELSADFDAAVHRVIDLKGGSAARTSAAIRYYLHAAVHNPRWAWAMMHTSLGKEVFGSDVTARARATIEEGVVSGEFGIASAELGKALLVGTCLAGTLDILHGRADAGYPEHMARSILLGLGVDATTARLAVEEPLTALRPVQGREEASPVNYWSVIPDTTE